jgi:uncharacterized integral membrane protein (TIGR00697 family)
LAICLILAAILNSNSLGSEPTNQNSTNQTHKTQTEQIHLERSYKFLPYLQALFICILLIANLIGAGKISQIEFTIPVFNKLISFPIGTGILFFPISYLIGDLLTEVYGFAQSRRLIWIGFGALILSTCVVQFIVWVPASAEWPNQTAYEKVFSISWRIVASSITAFAVGEFVNSYVMAKMKLITNGSKLWTRTIGSTICGEACDTLIFYPLAFLGNPDFPPSLIAGIMLANYLGKVLWEIIATPLTYAIIRWLKKSEHEDFYDRQTNFSPFHL